MDFMERNFGLLIFFMWFLPFFVSMFGRNPRLKGLTMALCLATMLSSPTSDILANVFWFAAWVSAIAAILAWFRPKIDRTTA